MPDSLDAKAVVRLPYRVVRLSTGAGSGSASGGGTGDCGNSGGIDYDYTCANGYTTNASASFTFSYANHDECNNLDDIEEQGPSFYTKDPVSWGSGSASLGPGYDSMSGAKCIPECDQTKECCWQECAETCKVPERCQMMCEPVGSSVNLAGGVYSRKETDLSVKVPGGTIDIQRRYNRERWSWNPYNKRLIFFGLTTGFSSGGLAYAPDNETYASVKRGNLEYRGLLRFDRGVLTDRSTFYFRLGQYKINVLDDGTSRWEDKEGNWELYEGADSDKYSQGVRMISYGNRNGVIGKMLYESEEDGKLIGISNRNDVQVLWFEYAGDLISAVYDNSNRRVEYEYADGNLTRVTDVNGYDTRFEYDLKNRISKITYPGGKETYISYEENGRLSSILDNDDQGYRLQYDYDKSKKEYYTLFDKFGMIKETWYNGETGEIRVNVNGRSVKTVQKNGRAYSTTDEQSNVTVKEYDEWDNLIKIIQPDSSTAINEYNHELQKLIKTTDERGIATEFEYDDNGNMTKKTEAAGTGNERITEYAYDADGNQLTVRNLGDDSTPETVATMTYDANGNMAAITDPEGNVTQFTSYDVMGNVLAKTDSKGKQWTYAYDGAGRLVSATDPMQHTVTYEYDGESNKIREVDAEGRETLFEYDSENNLIKSTVVADPSHPENNPATTFEYNASNKLIKQIDPEGSVITYIYDNEERLIKTVDGNGNEIVNEYNDGAGSGCSSCSGGGSGQPSRTIFPTFERSYSYDKRGRKTVEKDVLSSTESYSTLFEYDLTGNMTAKTDKEGKITSYEYDELNRLKKVIDPLGGEKLYSYDSRDNLIRLTDAEGNATQFTYNKNNQLIKETRPMGEETVYEYDGAGNLINKIDAKNQRTTYSYDDAGKLIEIRYYATSTDTEPAKTVTFIYDAVGNLTGYDDGTTSAAYQYDDLYRRISESVNYGPLTKTHAYSYLNNGLKQTFTGPDGITYGYLYDANNQLMAVQISNLGFITINDYHWNQPASMTLPGGSTKEFEYDPLMRVKRITTKDPGQNVLLNYQYSYDKVDNITDKQTEHGNYAYGYDDLYRLNTADNPIQEDEAFTYDLVGNRLTAANTTGQWAYNQNNELSGYDDATFEYDANGNMTKKTVGDVVTSYVYNIEDRLTQVWNGEAGIGTLIAIYYYDPFGRRHWKDVSGTRTYFHYSDEGLIGEYDVSGTEVKAYGYKPGSTWTKDPLFMKVGTEYYFYQNDYLGTPQKMNATNGAVVWSATYSSFGEATVDASSTVTNPLRFPGQYHDNETGLHYNWHRDYQPGIGRYIESDPKGGITEDDHRYIYVEGNPLSFIDPMGLECKSSSDCLTCITYAEAGGTNDTCKKAAAWTVINRKNDSNNFVGQNDCCKVASAYMNGVKQYDAYDNDRWNNCCNDCLSNEEKRSKNRTDRLVSSPGTDNTLGSTYFHDSRIGTPPWIKRRIRQGKMAEVVVPSCSPRLRFYKITD